MENVEFIPDFLVISVDTPGIVGKSGAETADWAGCEFVRAPEGDHLY